MQITIGFSFAALGRRLRQLARLAPSGSQTDPWQRRRRNELTHMSARELNDLGIGRGDIPGMLDDPLAWRRDRR